MSSDSNHDLVLSYKKEIIEQAMKLTDTRAMVNIDLNKMAVKYKRMAPIIISKRMKHLIQRYTAATDATEEQLNNLRGLCEEMETAQQYSITTGEFKMIELSAKQSDGTVCATMIAYALYEYKKKPVCDMVFIDVSQKTTVDNYPLVGMGALGLLPLLVPGVNVVELLGIAVAGVAGLIAAYRVKKSTTNQAAEAFLLKTLKDYGLVEFVDDNKLKLLTD